MGASARHTQLTRDAPAAAALSLIALVLSTPAVGKAYVFPDSRGYIDWPSDFIVRGLRVMGARPVGYPLFIDVFGTGAALAWAQTVLSIAAWSLLGWLVARLPGVALGCALSLAAPIWRWNVCALSESLSLSMMATSLALSIVLARRGALSQRVSRALWSAWAFCSFMFLLSRDTNLILLPMLLLPAMYLRGRPLIAALLVPLLAASITLLDAKRNERGAWALNNAIIGRVMVSPAAVDRFRAEGMPTVSDTMRRLAGVPGSRTQKELRRTDPDFFRWTQERGAEVYWKWVLSRPSSITEAWQALQQFYAKDAARYTRHLELRSAVKAMGSLYALGPPPWLTLLLPVFVVWAYSLERRIRPELAASLIASMSALSYAFLTYHADAYEVHRHMFQGFVLQRAALLIGIGSLVASFVSVRQSGRAHAVIAATE